MSKQIRAEGGWTTIGGEQCRIGTMPRMQWLLKQHAQRQWVKTDAAGATNWHTLDRFSSRAQGRKDYVKKEAP